MRELRDLFLQELADIYDAEHQLLKALPRMAEAAVDAELKEAFSEHLKQTQTHVDRLKQVFEKLGHPAKGKPCKAMQGLIAEGEERIKEYAGDAALICAAQKVEHYEIASYGTVCSWARLLEEEDAEELLNITLDEEKAADQKLTDVAEETINIEAAEGEAEAEEEEEA
ncbi:MAG: ferritin-like domain-containing protein [Verrucomicrobia subdivision 3 bacterium]|nr:ferritin-like domain-containing protein [Limisphaerales bacterium]